MSTPQTDQPETDPGFWWRLVHLDPALLFGVAMAVALLLGSLGVTVATEIPGQVVGVVAATLAIVQAVWTRRRVTANARVVVYAPDPVGRPSTVVAGEAVTEATDRAILRAARDTPSGPVG